MNKGEQTRLSILDTAYDMARQVGLQGLTVGTLADRLGKSKSGVFAHFGSKEELQLAVMEEAEARFRESVVRPAFAAPRGLARLRALFDRWLAFSVSQSLPGGCLMVQAAAEFDDQPGAVRDLLVEFQLQWRTALIKAVQMAVDKSELTADTDTEQFAFEITGLVLAAHQATRLLGFDDAHARARRGLERLIAANLKR